MKINLQYSKRPYVRTLHLEDQATVGSSLMIMNSNKYQAVRFLSRFLIYDTVNVHNNFHFIEKHVKFQHSNTIKYNTCI